MGTESGRATINTLSHSLAEQEYSQKSDLCVGPRSYIHAPAFHAHVPNHVTGIRSI